MANATTEFLKVIDMKKFRFHLLGLAHLPVSEKYMACAFTQKIVKMSKILLGMGHEVYLYGSEGSDAPCTEFIQTHTLSDIKMSWGEGDNRFDIGYDWKNNQFKHDFNSEKTACTLKYYKNCITEINKRKKDDDYLMITQGLYQKVIGDAVGLYLTIEPGVGYKGSYANFKAFESSYIQNFTYGSQHPFESINGNYYDRVIPNYFDLKDFPKKNIAYEKQNYFAYVGRQIPRKGIDTAIKTCDAIGAKLKIAGQGTYPTSSKNVEFVGYVDAKKRFDLMTKAKAVFVPTLYLEPFGGVGVEAMLCGTPIITTNFGVFPEYVDERVGFRCDTLSDFVKAAKEVEKLDVSTIRSYAENKFSMEAVGKQYHKWFEDLYNLYLSAKTLGVSGWHKLD